MKENPKILLVKLRALGDVLTTFPLLRALKERFPKAEITFFADEIYRETLEANPRIDAVWTHPAGMLRQLRLTAKWQHHMATVEKIKAAKFDLYLDLYGSLRTVLWGFLADIPERYGFALRGRKYFYHHPVAAQYRYVVDINLQFARLLGWQGTNNTMEFFIPEADHVRASTKLRKAGLIPGVPYVVISPGGGWPLKCWGPDKFGALAERLAALNGCQIVLSGSVQENDLINQTAAHVHRPWVPMEGWTLGEVAAVIRGAALFVGNDSGPKYLAESFKIPTLIFYGPTDYLNNNPNHSRHVVAVRDVSCRPCHSERCRAGRRACLDDLSVDEVFEKAQKLYHQSLGECL
jgi:lipopolysaccharide heptosyltransferase II